MVTSPIIKWQQNSCAWTCEPSFACAFVSARVPRWRHSSRPPLSPTIMWRRTRWLSGPYGGRYGDGGGGWRDFHRHRGSSMTPRWHLDDTQCGSRTRLIVSPGSGVRARVMCISALWNFTTNCWKPASLRWSLMLHFLLGLLACVWFSGIISLADSPAEECGLKPGNRILFLNGLDMRSAEVSYSQ